jgi:peroxiredoxin
MLHSRRLSPTLCVAALLLGLIGVTQFGLAGSRAAAAGPKLKLEGIRLKDDNGKVRTAVELKGRRAVVLVFLGTTCPVANSYAENLADLAKEYRPQGVEFVGVNANPDESLADVAKHAREFRLGFPVLKDDKQALANAVGAKVTPEVFVLAPNCAVVYRGRIDDRYASRTKSGVAKQLDLRTSLEAVLAGKPVPHATTTALGCAIVRPVQKASRQAKVTYHRNVAPILQSRCQSCHRPGQVAPFSLLTYRDARNWAAEIKEFTSNRQMPPWLAEPGHGDFQDVRRLSDEEVRTLAEWSDAGAPEGNAKDAQPARKWSDEWMLGKPDLVLAPDAEFEVAASGEDLFQVFVLPTNLLEDREVVAVDFLPGNSRVVHHVVSFVDRSGKARELDAKEPGPGYSSGPGGIKVPAMIQGVWAPGNLPRFLPPGVGRPLPKGADIVIQVHYHKTGRTEKDRTRVALYFAKEPVKQMASTTIVGPFNINIPPDAPRHEQRASMTLPIGVRVLNIMPHMHLLGKEMKVTATLPDGATRDMVWIKDWDYRWQDSYRYKEPLFLPKGTKIEIVAYYDNTSANPRNPSNPPKRVRFGEQTTDEMGFAIMEIIPETPLLDGAAGGAR